MPDLFSHRKWPAWGLKARLVRGTETSNFQIKTSKFIWGIRKRQLNRKEVEYHRKETYRKGIENNYFYTFLFLSNLVPFL